MLNFFLDFFLDSFLDFFLDYFLDFFFFEFLRDFQHFWDNSFLEIPRGPRGIDFIFLDPRGM